MSTLVNRNVTVSGHRTSMRLEPAMWEALEEICRRETMTVHEVCSLVDSRRTQSSLTAAMRVFILGYFRAAVADSQEAGRAASLNGAIGYVAGTPRTNGGAQLAVTV
jgi:predicted DNA-binding ribbon-helix-helix protein